MWIIPPASEVIEPAPAPEVFITGVGAIERIGEHLRFYCVAEQLTVGGDKPAQVVVVKIVRPLVGITDTAIQLLRCSKVSLVPELPPRPFRPLVVT